MEGKGGWIKYNVRKLTCRGCGRSCEGGMTWMSWMYVWQDVANGGKGGAMENDVRYM